MNSIKEFLKFLKGCYCEETQTFFDGIAFVVMIFIVSLFTPDLAGCLAIGFLVGVIMLFSVSGIFNRFTCAGMLLFQFALYAIVLIIFRHGITIAILAHFIMTYISAILVLFLLSDLTIPRETQYKAPFVKRNLSLLLFLSLKEIEVKYGLLNSCNHCECSFSQRNESGKSIWFFFVPIDMAWSRVLCGVCGKAYDRRLVFDGVEIELDEK